MDTADSVISLKGASIYQSHDPFGNSSAKNILRHGELILSDVNLEVKGGEFVYLMGRVGSGKSSLLKVLYAELQLVAGEGHVAGFDLRRLRRKDIPHLRRRMGIVFQDYQLLNDRNTYMNLHYVLRATGWRGEAAMRRRIEEVLTMVELQNKGHKMPFELSGGEQQRLTIARALLNSPKILLVDEPTGNLDPITADGIMAIFRAISQSGCAVVMSTHNTALVEQFPARTIFFSGGEIREVDLSKLEE